MGLGDLSTEDVIATIENQNLSSLIKRSISMLISKEIILNHDEIKSTIVRWYASEIFLFTN